MSDSQVFDLVRRDGIDILIDLALHTNGNRLLMFARKPVPVQVTYLAYCSTIGVRSIDYHLHYEALRAAPLAGDCPHRRGRRSGDRTCA